MNSSLDQLLNLHSNQPAIAGSPMSVTVHKFSKSAFDPGRFRLHRCVFFRQLSLPQNFIFWFVFAELKIRRCKPTMAGRLFGRNERCDAARFQFADQRTAASIRGWLCLPAGLENQDDLLPRTPPTTTRRCLVANRRCLKSMTVATDLV